MTRRLAYVSVAVFIALAVASLALAQGRAGGGARGGGAAEANAPTPRMPDGHPDISGTWGGGGGGGREFEVDAQGNSTDIFPSRRCAPSQVKCSEYTNQSYDGEFTARMQANRPLYKPRVLGQDPVPRHEHEQGGSDLRVPAARRAAGRAACAHPADGQ